MSNILALNLEEALGDIPIGLMAMKASLTLALADFEPASARIRPSNNNLTVEGMKTLTESKQRQASVLLVEDEALIRMMIAGMIEGMGHTVVAEAENMGEALKLAQTADFEIAVLDINAGGTRIDPVADIISERCLPFVFASGYGAAGMPERYRDRPVLQKPFLAKTLRGAIETALGGNGGH